jgi:GPI mannosyltransferase 3
MNFQRIRATGFAPLPDAHKLRERIGLWLRNLNAVVRGNHWPLDFHRWSERRYFGACLALSAFLFVTCSFFSVGSYQADEYFQTVEFASTKLAISDPAELPWEYGEKMRPWLQPAMYALVGRAAGYFGIHRPLTLYFLFRLLTAALAWLSLWGLIVAGRHWLNDEAARRRLYAVAALLWLLPFVAARTSAETMSTTALCAGIAVLEWRRQTFHRHGAAFGLAVLGGIPLGLCFVFRPASGIMAAGAGLFYLLQRRGRLFLFAGLSVGVFFALALGLLADFWGYGQLTFSAYRYVHTNFILGRSSAFGTSPFFAYLYMPIIAAGPLAPLAAVLVVATVIAWVLRPLNVVTWATAPYVAVLSVVPHKEPRFLLPLAFFLPFLLAFASEPQIRLGERLSTIIRWLGSGYRLRLAYGLNFFGLLAVVLLPEWSRAGLYAHLADESYGAKAPVEIAVVHTRHKTPYRYVEVHMGFLEPKNLRWILDPTLSELELKAAHGERFLGLIDVPEESQERAAWIRSRCTFVWSTYPRWLRPYNVHHWEERSYWWELYRCGA